MPLFSAGNNDPGYLPESPPTITRDWQLARDALIEDLRFAADTTQTWADPHDCDDIPCPTYGEDCPDNLAADLRTAAGQLQTVAPLTAWQATVGRRAWWLEDLGDQCPECGYQLAEGGWPGSHRRPGDRLLCLLRLDEDGTVVT